MMYLVFGVLMIHMDMKLEWMIWKGYFLTMIWRMYKCIHNAKCRFKGEVEDRLWRNHSQIHLWRRMKVSRRESILLSSYDFPLIKEILQPYTSTAISPTTKPTSLTIFSTATQSSTSTQRILARYTCNYARTGIRSKVSYYWAQVKVMGTSLQDCDSTPGDVVASFQYGTIRAWELKLY